MKTPGPQNPGVTGRIRKLKKKSYFFLAAFFLAAGFLAAFFFAAILVYLLHSISDPMNVFGGGSQMHSSKGSATHQLVASVIATMSSTTFNVL
jgi:hypothetical protein